MDKSINLHRPRRIPEYDAAGVSITKIALPPPYVPGPYASDALSPQNDKSYYFVPSLSYFCILSLYKFSDQLHAIGNVRLRYRPPGSAQSYDLLRALIPLYPLYPDEDSQFDLVLIDPRLWATLIQIYSNLPAVFHTYRIPLSDIHLPLLQRIQSTPEFTLITILELADCPELTDDTIHELRHLHNLCAFDASDTLLTTYGVQRFSKTLQLTKYEEGMSLKQRPGPWQLRILRLRNCDVNNNVLTCLASFIFLSVVDLRGTLCTRNGVKSQAIFHPSEDRATFYSASVTAALAALSGRFENVFSSTSKPYIIHITSLSHLPLSQAQRYSKSSVVIENSVVDFLPPHASKKSGSQFKTRPTKARSELQSESRTRHYNSLHDAGIESGRRFDSCDEDDSSQSDSLNEYGSSERSHAEDDMLFSPTSREIEPAASVRGRPIRTTPILPAAVDVQAIVEAEGREEAARQAARLFYQSRFSETRGHRSPERRFRQLEGPRGSYKHDAYLMLFRDPPPWSDLDKLPSAVKTASVQKSRAAGLAVVDPVKLAAGKQMVDSLWKKRKTETVEQRVEPATPPQSKNPFRRNATAIPLACSSGGPHSAKGPPRTSEVRGALKPISSLPMPVFPGTMRENKPRVRVASAAGAATASRTDSRSTVPQVSAHKSAVGQNNKAPSRPTPGGPFNWKAWSARSEKGVD